MSLAIAGVQWIIVSVTAFSEVLCSELVSGPDICKNVPSETTLHLPGFGLTDKAVPGLELPANCHCALAGTQKRDLY